MAVAATREGIEVKNPVTGEVIGTVVRSSREDVETAVEHARAVQHNWNALGVRERCRVMRKWGDLLWEDQQQAMRTIRDETGKTDTGGFIEVIGVDNAVNYYTQHAPKLLSPQVRSPGFPVVQRGKVIYKPHGVVGIISPWNYPMALAMLDAIPALIAGNAVVFKPSEITPYSVLYAVDLMHRAGVPTHVAQVVTGDGNTGAALVDLADYIGFTGSTAVGRQIGIRAAERLIPCSLELGGKDAMLVLKDANIELAASGAVIGACENAGQMCISVERVYVEAPIYDRFVARVKHFAEQVAVGAGDGFDVHMGSMTHEREVQRVEEHIRDAVEKGAEVIAGGKRRPELGPNFFEPTVLVNVDHSMKVMREETFGPLIPIMKVGSEAEAIRLANDSEYGLSGTIFTTDLDRGERLAMQLNTGDISVNRHTGVAGSPRLPWGGQKHSGIGRRGGPEGLMRFVTPQSILVDTQIGMKPSVTLVDPIVLAALKFMRVVRRWLPFV